MEIRYITTNTYYDQQDISQPIKTFIKVSPFFFYTPGFYLSMEFTIAPSQINFLNGTMSMVYEIKDTEVIHMSSSSNLMFLLQYAYIDTHYIIYQEYLDYQPQFENTRRQLNDSRNVSFIRLTLI